jgi:GH35 family endo-1,4-beta-xylanase
MKKIHFLCILFFSLLASSQTLPTGQRLKDINPSILIGSVMQTGYTDTKNVLTNNTPIQIVYKREFNMGQPTCYPAWDTWTGLKTYNFTEFNKTVNWLVANQMPVMAHLLAGPDNYFPEWFKTNTYNAVELDSMLVDFIRAIIRSNNNFDRVDYWNVVNESLWWNGHYYNTNATDQSCKLQSMGYETDMSGLTGTSKVHTEHPVYIRKAFEYARRYTTKKLELRDYGAEFWGNTKTKALYQLALHLKNSGVPIDAVGLQCHFDIATTYDWNKLKQTIQEYRKIGIEVYLTEIDFADKLKAWTPSKAETQKQLYKALTKAAIEAGAKMICVWGLRDNWNPYWLLDNSPLLFANDLTTKPAYYGVQEGLTTSTAINELNLNSIQMFPNPAKNYFNIVLNEPLNGGSIFTLINSNGMEILTKNLVNPNQTMQLNLPENLNAGIYFVKVSSQTSGQIWTSKLMVK